MTTGTKIVQAALRKIKVHSPLQPASNEALDVGKDTLNSMIAEMEDDDIKMGAVPLKTIASELSEPLGARNAIENILALRLAPEFPGAQVSNRLTAEAARGMALIKSNWQTTTIPKKKVRGTLPRGAGNNTGWRHSPFFDQGDELG